MRGLGTEYALKHPGRKERGVATRCGATLYGSLHPSTQLAHEIYKINSFCSHRFTITDPGVLPFARAYLARQEAPPHQAVLRILRKNGSNSWRPWSSRCPTIAVECQASSSQPAVPRELWSRVQQRSDTGGLHSSLVHKQRHLSGGPHPALLNRSKPISATPKRGM